MYIYTYSHRRFSNPSKYPSGTVVIVPWLSDLDAIGREGTQSGEKGNKQHVYGVETRRSIPCADWPPRCQSHSSINVLRLRWGGRYRNTPTAPLGKRNIFCMDVTNRRHVCGKESPERFVKPAQSGQKRRALGESVDTAVVVAAIHID